MIAFVCAVNAAIFIDGTGRWSPPSHEYLLAGLTGGFVGAGMMALGVALLPAGPRDFMRVAADADVRHRYRRLAGVDNALDLDLDLGALSGLAGLRRGRAGDGVAGATDAAGGSFAALTARSSASPSCWDGSGSNTRSCPPSSEPT